MTIMNVDPQINSDAWKDSSKLEKQIADEIRSQGNWLPFSRFMEMALYEPGLGYYRNGKAKLGKAGDFYTAPEITPLFGQALARTISFMLRQTAPEMIEFGAGSGSLARTLLESFRTEGLALSRYAIVETSPELRAQQAENLREFRQVVWLDALPETFSGVILGNEVLDAMPVKRIVRRDGQWHEQGVTLRDGLFVSDERPATASLMKQIRQCIPDHEVLPEGYQTELQTQAAAFLRTLASFQAKSGPGAGIFIDYGFPAHEYYHAQRSKGTLAMHTRQRVHFDPFARPGEEDMTSHIDFSAMAAAVTEGGMELLCYASQSDFLIASGILERLGAEQERLDNPLQAVRAVQCLVSPHEMGELFKVFIYGDVRLPESVNRVDCSERL